MSAVFRQSSTNGDGDGENDRKEGFHSTKVLRGCPLACVYPMVVSIAHCESPLLARNAVSFSSARTKWAASRSFVFTEQLQHEWDRR